MNRRKPLSPVQRLKDHELIQKALRKGAAEAMLRHKAAGVPAAVWRDGQVFWIQPEDIEIDEDILNWDPAKERAAG